MVSVKRTAYPSLKKQLNEEELTALYSLSQKELSLICQNANGNSQRLTFAVLLKTYQVLYYFPNLQSVSPKAAENDARDAKHSMSKTSISIINSLLQNKKGSYPNEELKILKGMLEEVKSSIGSEAFRDKVTLAKSSFQSLKQIWKKKSSLPKDQLNVIEENLTNLTENAEEYIERKKERLLSILGTIPIDLSEPDILSRSALIIKDIQLGKTSSNDLESHLHELGIKGDEKNYGLKLINVV